MLQTVLQMHAYKYDISIWTYTRCTSRNDFRSVLVENTTNSRRNARWQVQHSIYMFMHFPYSLQYAVLVHVHFGSMVLLLVLMLLAVLVLERWKRATLASKALRSGRPGAHPKKGQQKHTIPHFSHPCAGHECHPKLYKHIIYDINLFRFKGKWSWQICPVVSKCPTVLVANLGSMPSAWHHAFELVKTSNYGWETKRKIEAWPMNYHLEMVIWSNQRKTNKEFMTTSQQSRLSWPPILSFSI